MNLSLPFDPVEKQLKVGIEVHQQLGTSTKLFCSCPIVKSERLPFSFQRRLRPSQSELGHIDPAAIFEFHKGKVNFYEWNPESSCLVEADEEPPHQLNREALETGILVSEMLGADVVDEVHVMRKIVIDGSNTSGFQRTAVVSLGGRLAYDGETVGVQTVTVEEDAARILGEDKTSRHFALDRLGVPLVEIALDPIVGHPERIESAALHLGRALRSTGRVARGLGTIRQDLNVSLLGGEVIEVKGVQKLNLIAKVVHYEARRQMALVSIAEELKKRGIETVTCRTRDVTELLRSTSSSALKRVLSEGGRVACISADGMAGLLGKEPYPGVRLGKELAEIARSGSLGGIIHSDEFRKQGVSEMEESDLRKAMSAEEGAGLLLVAGDEGRVSTVAQLLVDRLRKATRGAVGETRAATDEGETRYLRPRPGAARMYPETDIPEIVITDAMKETARGHLPIPWEQKIQEYVEDYSLSKELATQVYDSDYAQTFEALARELSLETSVTASTLVEAPVRLAREGVDLSRITSELLVSVLRAMDKGRFAKEAAVDVLRLMAKGEVKTVDEAVAKLGITGLSKVELDEIINDVIAKNRALIDDRGERAFSVLMGEVMKSVRGRVDGEKVSALLRERMGSKVSPR
jgi:glutamyl-tRNA(Gln) amidotransferase subunit E